MGGPRIRSKDGSGWVELAELDNVITYGQGRVMNTAGVIGEGSDSRGLLILTSCRKPKAIATVEEIALRIATDGVSINHDDGSMIHNAELVLQFENVAGLDVLLTSLLQIRGMMVVKGHENPEWPTEETLLALAADAAREGNNEDTSDERQVRPGRGESGPAQGGEETESTQRREGAEGGV